MPLSARSSIALVLSILGFAFILSAGEGRAQGQTDFGRLNPDAPPETEQFAFLVGHWDVTIRTLTPDGQTFREASATWTGYFILDGWAIQDDWVTSRPDGTTFNGTNIRSFNPQTMKWDNRWLPSGSLQWTYFEAEQVDDSMVMVGGAGRDGRGEYIDRNTFHDVEPDSWRWRKDRSYDGGTTWIEGISFIEASRAS